MLIEEALYHFLTEDHSVALLASTRVYPLSIPQDIALPAVAYQRISGPRLVSHDGATELAGARFQITVQDDSYDGAKHLAEAIRRAVGGFRGVMGGGNGVQVDGVWVESELDGYGMTSSIYTVRLDLEMAYREI